MVIVAPAFGFYNSRPAAFTDVPGDLFHKVVDSRGVRAVYNVAVHVIGGGSKGYIVYRAYIFVAGTNSKLVVLQKVDYSSFHAPAMLRASWKAPWFAAPSPK